MYKHYALTPEYFHINPFFKNKEPYVKALFISDKSTTSPQVLMDTSSKILSTVFKEEKPYPIFFKNGYHMFISPSEQMLGTYVNFPATFFVRNKYLTDNGNNYPEQICGNVVIFGTINISKGIPDNNNYSVPYPIVEEFVKIYGIQKHY